MICPNCRSCGDFFYVCNTTSCDTERWRCAKCGITFNKIKQDKINVR